MGNDIRKEGNERLIKRLKQGIATAKGVDGDFVYVTVGDAKRILKAFGIDYNEVSNPYVNYIIKALECRSKRHERCDTECFNCQFCHWRMQVKINDEEYLENVVCDEKRLLTDTINLLKFLEDKVKELLT